MKTSGEVAFVYKDLILLNTSDGKTEVILAGNTARLQNLHNRRDLLTGDYIEVVYAREAAQVKIADEIAADSAGVDPSLDISTQEVAKLLTSGAKYALVDIRSAEKYLAGHIPDAVSMPYAEFDLDRLPPDKDTRIIFYAKSVRDVSSSEAAKRAIAAGHRNVKVYSGGMQAWTSGDDNYTVTTVEHVKRSLEQGRPLMIIDTRSAEKAAEGYIPFAVNVPVKLEEFRAQEIMLEMGRDPYVFYGEDSLDERPNEFAVRASRLIGRRPVGESPLSVLEGGFSAWEAHNLRITKGAVITPETFIPMPFSGVISFGEFKRIWAEQPDKVVFLDVREQRPDFMDAFTFVTHIPVHEVPFRITELPGDKEILIFCTYGARARVVYHILKNNGFNARYLNDKLPLNPDGTIGY